MLPNSSPLLFLLPKVTPEDQGGSWTHLSLLATPARALGARQTSQGKVFATSANYDRPRGDNVCGSHFNTQESSSWQPSSQASLGAGGSPRSKSALGSNDPLPARPPGGARSLYWQHREKRQMPADLACKGEQVPVRRLRLRRSSSSSSSAPARPSLAGGLRCRSRSRAPALCARHSPDESISQAPSSASDPPTCSCCSGARISPRPTPGLPRQPGEGGRREL